MLPDAARQTVGEFRVAVGKAVLHADPASAEQRRQRALGDRCVRVRPVEDGMASLWALLPAEGAAAVMAAVDALASVTSADDPRTADHRRADALVDLGAAALHDPHLPRAQGLRPHIQVTVALSTLLGLDEHPADLGGYGAIHAELARRIAADATATWRRLVTDPIGGALLDVGRRTYRPPADLARFVIARDRQCVLPHCHRPADRCDLDHRIRYSDGGATSVSQHGTDLRAAPLRQGRTRLAGAARRRRRLQPGPAPPATLTATPRRPTLTRRQASHQTTDPRQRYRPTRILRRFDLASTANLQEPAVT